MTSTPGGRHTAAVAWAVAVTVVALVVGVLGLVWMNRTDGPAGTATPADPGTATAAPTTSPAPDDADPSGAAPTLTPEQEQYLLGLQRRDPDDVAALGSVDAPVVIIEYADHRCPFCARWAREVRPQLQPLIDDGTVRLEYRDVILFGEQSEDAALAARAAGQQGRYWELHDAIAEAAPESGHPDLPRSRLVELAEVAGVPDLAAFEAALDDPDLRAALDVDREEAARLGVTSTPSFLVNTTAVVGAQPVEVFHEVIAQELERDNG